MQLSMLLPLHYFYAKESRALPDVQFLDAAAIPEPEQSLLVHDRDMTSTLRKFGSLPASSRACSKSSYAAARNPASTLASSRAASSARFWPISAA